MVNYALVGRCGIFCGSCGLYRAYRDGGEYLQQVSEAWEMPVEKILCEGCHALTVNCAGSKCKIVNCLNSRGIEFCYECPEYNEHSCEKYEGLAKRWAVDNVDLRANLERIKAGAVEDWLKECEERFRCQKCGEPLPILGWNVKKRCYHCGVELSKQH